MVQAAAGGRAHLTLTRFSLELLLGFLHAARLSLVLSILNEHADFQVVVCSSLVSSELPILT